MQTQLALNFEPINEVSEIDSEFLSKRRSTFTALSDFSVAPANFTMLKGDSFG